MPDIETLINELQYTRLTAVFLRAEMPDALLDAARKLKQQGQAHESSGDLVSALRAYQAATFAMARRADIAPSYAHLRRQQDEARQYGRDFGMALRKYLKQKDAPQYDADGTPITADAIWEHGFQQMRTWAISGEFELCRRFAGMLDTLWDDDGDRNIRNSGIFEDIGDALQGEHKQAACWFYDEASTRFSGWVSSASSGGEGMARSGVPKTAAQKLKQLKAELRADKASTPPETELEQLIDTRQWARLTDAILESTTSTPLRNAARQLKKVGAAYQEQSNLFLALRAYQIGSYAMARFLDLAKTDEQRDSRWNQLDMYNWEFCLAHREYKKNKDAPDRDKGGCPITVDAIWEDGFTLLEEWAIGGHLERCRRYNGMLDSLRDDDAHRGISNSGRFQRIGTKLKAKHKEAARWFYQQAAGLFDDWQAGATGSGEGIARSLERNTAKRKLQQLDEPPQS